MKIIKGKYNKAKIYTDVVDGGRYKRCAIRLCSAKRRRENNIREDRLWIEKLYRKN